MGGTITSAWVTIDDGGLIVAVPTFGTVTVSAEEAGTPAILLGGAIMAKSLVGFGNDLNSTFQFADKGENRGIRNVYD